jgi:hypothetical protein
MKILSGKNSICAYLLAASLIVSSCPSYTFDLPSARTAALTAGGVGLAASFLALYKRRPEPQFKYRFIETYEKLKTKKNFTQKDIKDIARLLYYLYYDGFIGQTSSSSKLKADKDARTVDWSESADAFGVLGNANEYFRPFKSTFETLGVLFFAYNLFRGINPYDKKAATFTDALLGAVDKKSQSV